MSVLGEFNMSVLGKFNMSALGKSICQSYYHRSVAAGCS